MKRNKVDLYVKSKTSIYYTQPACRGGGKGWAPEGGIGYASARSSEYTLSEKESRLKVTLEVLSKRYDLELNIHDLVLKAKAKRAKAIGVKSTRLILVNDHKIFPVPPDEDSLLKLLNHYLPNIIPLEREAKFHSGKDRTIDRQKLDGITIIDLSKFSCSDCRSHKYKILKDYSGFCAECGKAYMEIKVSG